MDYQLKSHHKNGRQVLSNEHSRVKTLARANWLRGVAATV